MLIAVLGGVALSVIDLLKNCANRHHLETISFLPTIYEYV